MKSQDWEQAWWGNCANTLGEELKQTLYAEKMGLTFHHNGKSHFNIDMKNQSVLDIGGGPCSLLLKCTKLVGSLVCDPCHYPQWVTARYQEAGIGVLAVRGEDLANLSFDEVWFYNVLQHTDDPELICSNARMIGKIVRVFEWIDTGVNEGHPHSLTEAQLNAWMGGRGKVAMVHDRGCNGFCWYGIFNGKS